MKPSFNMLHDGSSYGDYATIYDRNFAVLHDLIHIMVHVERRTADMHDREQD
jgi:Zn-dependent peptidase ImmA (M78 family)